jgi:hypothetical protein
VEPVAVPQVLSEPTLLEELLLIADHGGTIAPGHDVATHGNGLKCLHLNHAKQSGGHPKRGSHLTGAP